MALLNCKKCLQPAGTLKKVEGGYEHVSCSVAAKQLEQLEKLSKQ